MLWETRAGIDRILNEVRELRMFHMRSIHFKNSSVMAFFRIALFLMLLVLGNAASAQNRKDLEKKREALDKQIRTTTALIEQARREQKLTQGQLELLGQQIEAREQLIRTMNSELKRVDERIEEDEEMISSLRSDMISLKEEYGRMLQFAYRNRSSYDRMSYIFAANSFQQAYKRSRYLNQIGEQRKRQAALIEGTQITIEERLASLKEQREEKNQLVSQQLTEKQKLNNDRSGQQNALNSLKKEEGKLKETQRKQEKQRKDIDSAIRKAIEAELKPKGGTTASGKLDLTLTPEAKALNADFEKNKGSLPWPVEKGVVT
ncbi:MAG: hypothetical protein M3R08_01505, partial [Bacteroidota bacterium]|nr:hypothetical protein [Bacteroidota bacterium]